jgi:hypothetical protein
MLKFETDVRPLGDLFVPRFAVGELFAILAGFKPDIILGLEQIKASAETLRPPAELNQDHERLLVYLEQQLEAARLIPDQPTNTPFVGQGPPSGRTGAPPNSPRRSCDLWLYTLANRGRTARPPALRRRSAGGTYVR